MHCDWPFSVHGTVLIVAHDLLPCASCIRLHQLSNLTLSKRLRDKGLHFSTDQALRCNVIDTLLVVMVVKGPRIERLNACILGRLALARPWKCRILGHILPPDAVSRDTLLDGKEGCLSSGWMHGLGAWNFHTTLHIKGGLRMQRP